MTFKDECMICGRVFPYSYLKRCQRCGRLFCRDCMVPDVSTGDPTRMLCLNCARRVVSRRSFSKYEALKRYLKYRAAFTNVVKLSLPKIDGIMGDNLPMSAFHNEKWWSNSPNSVHAKAWLDTGWKMQEVNLEEGYVVFEKVKRLQPESHRRKRSREKVKKPFTPAPYHAPRTRKPSKTRVAKIYARFKNLERKRASMPKYRGSFKPKSAYEKRLYRSEEKPK